MRTNPYRFRGRATAGVKPMEVDRKAWIELGVSLGIDLAFLKKLSNFYLVRKVQDELMKKGK